jgi:hypothetical protein
MIRYRRMSYMEGGLCTYKILVGKPKGISLLGRSWHRWENNVKIKVKEIVFQGVY